MATTKANLAKAAAKEKEKAAAESIWDDLVEVGINPFCIIHEASSEKGGWKKTTSAMEIPSGGCLVLTTTQRRNGDGSYAISEALALAPGLKLTSDDLGAE